MKNYSIKTFIVDLLISIVAGFIVSVAYFFFQNSNGFAPGGVGGLATITYNVLDKAIPWAYLMIIFNIPIFILVTIFVDRKLGFFLIIYMVVQSFGTELLAVLGCKPYSYANNPDTYEVIFACIATGVVSGLGFSIMLRRFGASGGTYAIAALIKKAKPASSVSYLAFFLDGSVVVLFFLISHFNVTPAICTLINLFLANVVVDYFLSGLKNGYKFEIVTDKPDELSKELVEKLHHGVTEIRVVGMYSHKDKYMIVCIIRKKQIGEMMKILKSYPNSFASFSKVNEVFGRFRK